MDVIIPPFTPNGEFTAPPSKSDAQRLLLAAALADGETAIENVGNSEDVLTMLNCLQRLGAEVKTTRNGVTIKDITIPPEKAILDVGECGFVARTILPVALSLGVSVKLNFGKRMSDRPMSALYEVLKQGGINLNDDYFCGKLRSGDYKIRGDVSSQFISGMLFALAHVTGESVLTVIGDEVSSDYVKMTISALNRFGVDITRDGNVYHVVGGKLKAPQRVKCEGDYSSSAFLLAAGAINGKISAKGLNANSNQADRAIIDILRSFGAKVTRTYDTVTVESDSRRAIDFSCKDAPDLAPVAAVLAAYSDSESIIRDTARLKTKESDREKAMVELLTSAGIQSETDGDKITIVGGKPLGGRLKVVPDHRIVMAAAILASDAQSESVIPNSEFVAKSYPDFFKELGNVGLQR